MSILNLTSAQIRRSAVRPRDLGNHPNRQEEAGPPAGAVRQITAAAGGRATPGRSYQPWFAADPERWDLEVKAMRERNFHPVLLPDGRVAFEGTDTKIQAAATVVICPWAYPYQPPILASEAADDLDLPRTSDGYVDVFAETRPWHPSLAAVTVLDYLNEWLEMALVLKEREDANSVQEGPADGHEPGPVVQPAAESDRARPRPARRSRNSDGSRTPEAPDQRA